MLGATGHFGSTFTKALQVNGIVMLVADVHRVDAVEPTRFLSDDFASSRICVVRESLIPEMVAVVAEPRCVPWAVV
jgi:hypothetical protein